MPRKKLTWRDVWPITKTAGTELIADSVTSRAAAVAFYAALSLAPLLLLMLSITSLVGRGIQEQLVVELGHLLGPSVGDAMRSVIENARATPSSGVMSSIIGLLTLLVSATGVFVELQSAMNHIWDVEPKPARPVLSILRSRLLSLGLVVAIGFLLLVSMGASAALSAAMSLLGRDAAAISVLWRVADVGVSVVLFAAMFGIMFKLLPDVHVGTESVIVGALVTSVLFVAGKIVIGIYIGHSTIVSSYGAAGSLIAMLVWVYYSALIVFVGAELTQAWAAQRGDAIEPSEHARRRVQRVDHHGAHGASI